MVNLKWDGKKKRTEIFTRGEKSQNFQVLDDYPDIDSEYRLSQERDWQNLLIWGENKSIMSSLLEKYENKISLIYIDPPFATGGNFYFKIQIGEKGEYFEETAYKDKWKEGLDSYLDFLYERLLLMKKLLKNDGSIYVHLDWHISHYIKLLMDEIFGYKNFRNEIIWAYPAASAKTRRFFIRSYDTLLFYSKSNDYTFNNNPQIYMEYSNRVKNALKRDDKGVFYYRGGSHDGKKLSRKVYVEKEGIFPRDVWNDVPYIRANTLEYQGFSTQKPERLLKRIILASTNEKDLVADFFCGSGTTLAVAEKLGRRWIGCDSNKLAINIAKKRILDISNSNSIIDWKNLYNKNPHSFKLLKSGNQDQLTTSTKDLLDTNYKIADQVKTPKLEVLINNQENEVIVELTNYNISFTNQIPEDVIKKIESFSDLIDYWAIDYNYRRPVFNNMWVSFRTPKKRKLSLKSEPYLYRTPGKFDLSVKIIDIFGIETIKKFEIKIV